MSCRRQFPFLLFFSQIPDFFTWAKEKQIAVRFIEMMPIGYGDQYEAFSAEQIKEMFLQIRSFHYGLFIVHSYVPAGTFSLLPSGRSTTASTGVASRIWQPSVPYHHALSIFPDTER